MNPKARSRKKWWVIVGVVAIVALVIALLLNNVAGSTKPIKSAADKFKPPSDWTLISEDVEPPRFYCLNGGSCPELGRRWISSNAISFEALKSILDNTSWSYTLDTSCETMEQSAQEYGVKYLCTVDASTDSFRISIYVIKPEPSSDKFEISLDVRPL